jgi:hypothetical protein
MAFELSDIVPWGRTFNEYVAMFALGSADLRGTILGCGDGPASFNAEATGRGFRVISCDPIYRFPAEDIRSRINQITPIITQQLKDNLAEFVWIRFPNLKSLVDARLAAMDLFLADYATEANTGRYVNARLPSLPFDDGQFDLALCSHFLFLYSQQHDLGFHLQALAELCRVANEVRVFPLMELGSTPSRHLEPVIMALRQRGCSVEYVTVPYQFQKGADRMLRILPAPRSRARTT